MASCGRQHIKILKATVSSFSSHFHASFNQSLITSFKKMEGLIIELIISMQFPADFHGCCSFCMQKKKCLQARLLLQVTVGAENHTNWKMFRISQFQNSSKNSRNICLYRCKFEFIVVYQVLFCPYCEMDIYFATKGSATSSSIEQSFGVGLQYEWNILVFSPSVFT